MQSFSLKIQVTNIPVRAIALGSVARSDKPTYSRKEFLDKLEVRGLASYCLLIALILDE
ncbi:MAG: hypothetical protein HC847_05330 [Hydrococcus sp. RU_2_2]|nr:hypothetical protein [Hydrococcus sp. RU_2_2]NJP21552.1 hypothetical protein [Hydrococcus sp. CRU_1_1]